MMVNMQKTILQCFEGKKNWLIVWFLTPYGDFYKNSSVGLSERTDITLSNALKTLIYWYIYNLCRRYRW